MIQALWHRKIMVGRSKGLSTVIGTVFLMMVVFLISTNIFLWTLSQHNSYSQTVIQLHQMDADRFGEKVVVTDITRSVVGDKVKVNATLTNESPVPVQIITLWVVDLNTSKYGFNDAPRSLNINMNPGDSLQVNGEVTILGASSDHVFEIWFVTARGSLVSYDELYAAMAEKAKESWVSQYAMMTYAMGPVLLNFKSLRWYSSSSKHTGTWEINRTETCVEWSLNMTNWGNKLIILSRDCGFLISSMSQSQIWYIKKEYVLLPTEEEVTITFCWDKPLSGKYVTSQLPPTDIYAVYCIMAGTYENGDRYAQTVPFVAVKVN